MCVQNIVVFEIRAARSKFESRGSEQREDEHCSGNARLITSIEAQNILIFSYLLITASPLLVHELVSVLCFHVRSAS